MLKFMLYTLALKTCIVNCSYEMNIRALFTDLIALLKPLEAHFSFRTTR